MSPSSAVLWALWQVEAAERPHSRAISSLKCAYEPNPKPPYETALDPAYISAFSALAGAAIGGLASFSTSWMTQRTQIRHTQSEAERARLEALYSEFITESARLHGDALSHQKDDVADMVGLYALVGRMRLVSSPAVLLGIIATYQGPNLALHEVHECAREGRMNYLVEFGEAARADLAHRR
jgi:hypothetical protein